MDELKEAVPVLLLIIGAILQFLIRAQPKTGEGTYLVWAAGLCAVVFVLVNMPFHGAPVNVWLVRAILWIGDPADGAIMRVLAGTATTSILANIAVKFGANPANPAVPVTMQDPK